MKIKILVDGHIFDHSFQGTATYIRGIYTELVKDDSFEITLMAQNIDILKSLFVDSRFRFVQLHSRSKFSRLLYEIPAIIRKGNYDYAHFQYITPIIKECRYINTIHDLLFLEYKEHFPLVYRVKNYFLFRFSAWRSDVILTVSQYSKIDIGQRFGILPHNIFLTPNAVSIDDFAEVDVLARFGLNRYLLYVSRFEPRKNHISLLRSYMRLELYKEGIKLVFVGTKIEKIEKEAYRLLLDMIPNELTQMIVFLEHLSSDELKSLYKNADCFVFPSLAEGFGIPPIEAAVYGCKVLSSNRTAMADFDFFKYHFDPNNGNEFDSNLRSILSDQDYPFDEIRKQVLTRYTWTTVAKQLSAVLTADISGTKIKIDRTEK